MIISEATSRGMDNWRELDREQQFDALAWVVDWIHRADAVSEISPNAVRVGFGLRQKSGASSRTRLFKTPVLVVHVRRKWAQEPKRGADARRVPPWIQLRVPVGGRSLQLAVPTDVCAESPTPRAHADRRSLLVRSPRTNRSDKGSACALVRDPNNPTGPVYILTCHHVAFSWAVTRSAQDSPKPNVFSVASGANAEALLGQSTRPSRRFGPRVAASVDAALVKLDASGLNIASAGAFWGNHPAAWPATKGQLAIVATASTVRLVSKWGPATFDYVQHRFNQDVDYGAGRVVSIAQAVEFRSASGSRDPQPGDSGGAMIAGRNLLLGMHIAGVGDTSYVIPAYLLFSSAVFQPRIDIADNIVT